MLWKIWNLKQHSDFSRIFLRKLSICTRFWPEAGNTFFIKMFCFLNASNPRCFKWDRFLEDRWFFRRPLVLDAVEVIDSDIIDTIKTIWYRNKKRPDENTIADYLCKSYPDCNVTTIRQRITYLENKNKILNKPHNGRNSYYLIDGFNKLINIS